VVHGGIEGGNENARLGAGVGHDAY